MVSLIVPIKPSPDGITQGGFRFEWGCFEGICHAGEEMLFVHLEYSLDKPGSYKDETPVCPSQRLPASFLVPLTSERGFLRNLFRYQGE